MQLRQVLFLLLNLHRGLSYLQRENPGTSPATIKKKLAILQSMLTQAVKLDIIPMNPADAKRLTLPKMVTPKVVQFVLPVTMLLLVTPVSLQMKF